jgi:hypothetical protein
VNTLRGLLREVGLVIPEGLEKVLPQVRLMVADAESGLPDALRWTVTEACDEIESLGRGSTRRGNNSKRSRSRLLSWNGYVRFPELV